MIGGETRGTTPGTTTTQTNTLTGASTGINCTVSGSTVDLLGDARELIAAGVPVFVAKPAKGPDGQWDPDGGAGGYITPSGWQNTPAKLSTLDRFEAGDALGAVMGHAVDALDTDKQHDGERARDQLIAAGIWPTTYGTASTPSGGTHELIAPLGVGSRDGLRPGLDLKGGRPDGTGRGFIFIAPTVKRSKTTGQLERYRWIVPPMLGELQPGDDSGATLTGMVVEALSPATGEAKGTSSVFATSGADKHHGPIPVGERHPTLVSYAGYLRKRGVGLDLAETLVLRRLGDCAQPPDAATPVTDAEALGKLHDVYNRYDGGTPDLPTSEDGAKPPADPVKQAGKASAATQLVELAEASYRFGQSSKHEPFAVPLEGSNVARMLRGAGGSLRAELAAAYFAEHRKIAPQQALTDAVLTLEGMAQEAEPEVLQLRSAVAGESVWLDLGDTTGRAVQITEHGWWIRESAPVLFHRTALTAALPEPERGGSLAELWAMLNVAPADHPLVLAWLLAALLTPNLPCPVLALTGEQGTGKTTASKRTAALVDPTHPQVRRSPKDGEAWVSAATGSRVVALDNVSAIPEWFSDALCRAVTGDGDVRRRLYSDGDFHVIAFRRAVVVNGIDLGAVRDDLAERLLTVQLARITEDHRGRESDLERRWEAAHPRLLGAVLDLAVQVLAARDTCCPARLPRMADFAHTLATVDHVLGTDGLNRYRGQAEDIAADTVGSDPVLKAITATITTPWEGPGADLLEAITDHDGKTPKDWPGTARAMTGELRRKAPVLRRLGWTVDDLGRGGKAMVVRFSLVPPPEAGDRQATGRRQAGDRRPRQATANGVACRTHPR